MTTPITNQTQTADTFAPQMLDQGQKSEDAGPEYIVGIGASAGGLEALERFFFNVPASPRVAYVVIQHLSPDFKSMMSEILGRKTELKIQSAENGMAVEPGHVYLNTPRHDLRIEGGFLKLNPTVLEGRMPPRPIDTFFESMAKDKGSKGIAVVLSGTGTDGSLGAATVGAAGGLVITQDVDSALFPSMPQNAAAQGPADIVLPPDEMPAAIVDFIDSDLRMSRGDLSLLDYSLMTGENAFSYLLSMLQREYGIDYTLYKPQTLVRRVERRMALSHQTSLISYIHMLQDDQEEMDALYRDMMVDVTSFFRDPEAFHFLEEEVIPDLVKGKEEGEPIRVWIAGCASGEEAYSMTILLLEEMAHQGRELPLKIFATDAHKNSIVRAGAGVYHKDRFATVPPQLREKYFIQNGMDEFQIRPEVRRNIVFAPHNLLVDAHFTNLDIISCRNVLIYFGAEAQTRVMTGFHMGLALGGTLFLGASEHLGTFEPDYEPLNRPWRIYKKLRSGGTLQRPPGRQSRIRMPETGHTRQHGVVTQAWERGLLQALISSGFVVDEHGQLRQIYGKAERYVNFRAGRVDLALPGIVIDDLSTPVRTGLYRAQQENVVVRFDGLTIQQYGDVQLVNLTVTPFQTDLHSDEGKRQYLIEIDEVEEIEAGDLEAGLIPAGETKAEDLDRIAGLERDLAFTRESLQTTIEEVETTNEELQSSNEELIAANEELQSTNEELSSVNEELFTVNSEYQDKYRTLNRINQDMSNLLRSGRILALFLDRELRLRIITPATYELFGLLESDVGRPIAHFSTFVEIGTELLTELAQSALNGEENRTEVTIQNGTRLTMKTLPYYADQAEVDGVVLYFIEKEN